MKISRQTREIINIFLFFVIVGVVLTAFVIYPLNKTADLYARSNIDDYDTDSTVINDPAPYTDSMFVIDTFRVESDGLTTLAVLQLQGLDSGWTVSRGTIMLLPSEDSNRDEFVDMAALLIDSGFSVITMDLRATGRSTATYHGEGSSEADDLSAVIHYLSLREMIHEPFTVVGYSLGGDAAILAAEENDIISRVIAIEPYLTTQRMQDKFKEKHDMYWFPFYKTVMWFWYEIRSGNAPPYRGLEDIQAVSCETFAFFAPEQSEVEEISSLKEISNPDLLLIRTTPSDDQEIVSEIISIVCSR